MADRENYFAHLSHSPLAPDNGIGVCGTELEGATRIRAAGRVKCGICKEVAGL